MQLENKIKKDRLSSNANNNDHNRFSIFEEDDEEDAEMSEVSMSTSVASDVIINRKIKKRSDKIKVIHEEEEEEESDWEENHSYDEDKNMKCDLINNEPHRSAMIECKALEEHVHRLDIKNDKQSFFETMNQCHLVLMSNEKQVNRKRGMCECNELIDECNKTVEEKQHLRKTYNRLLVKHRKLINEHNEVINELAND